MYVFQWPCASIILYPLVHLLILQLVDFISQGDPGPSGKSGKPGSQGAPVGLTKWYLFVRTIRYNYMYIVHY